MAIKTITINANTFSDIEGFYDEIDAVLTKDLDWKTGHNLDAFNDLLRGGFGITNYEEPIKLVWLNSSKSKSDLGIKATIAYLTEILKRCHPTNRQSINEQIELLKQNKGETLYQIICDIIKGHEHIEFIQT